MGQYNKDGSYKVLGDNNFVMWGPYVPLNKGTYDIEFYYEPSSRNNEGNIGNVDIVADNGLTFVAAADMNQKANCVKIENLMIKEELSNVECRIFLKSGNEISIKKIIVRHK